MNSWGVFLMKYSLRLLFTLFIGLLTFAPLPAAAAEPGMVKVGLYLTDLYAINFTEKHFTVEFWAWFIHSQKKFKIPLSIGVPDSRGFKTSKITQEQKSGVTWDGAKYEAVINHVWDATFYPFDRQNLSIVLELDDLDTKQMRLVADEEGSKVHRDIILPGWTIEKTRMYSGAYTYNTAFGDPALSPSGPSEYGRVTFELEMKRRGWRLLFNDFIGFFFAIALASIVLCINVSRGLFEKYQLSTKLGLATGSLFASVGASYVMQSRIPPATHFTLADAVQLTAFAATITAVMTSLVIEALINHTDDSVKSRNTTLAFRLSRGAVSLFALVVLADLVLLIMAINS